jgi:DNA primase
VRELGAAAFEALVAKAVPLSRQLIELAADDADLGTAEGRSRMLAQAKPLWQALPDGALKRQLLPELARQAQLELTDLSSLWGTAPAPPPRRDHGAMRTPVQTPLRRAGRRPPAASADLAVRLLLRHSDWWERLAADDHDLLHALGGSHGAVIAWLEGQLVEHGPQTWSALEAAMAGQDWQAEAKAWVEAAAPEEEQCFEDLHRVVQRLLVDQLNAQAQALAATAADDRDDLERLRAVRDQIARIKAALAATPT